MVDFSRLWDDEGVVRAKFDAVLTAFDVEEDLAMLDSGDRLAALDDDDVIK